MHSAWHAGERSSRGEDLTTRHGDPKAVRSADRSLRGVAQGTEQAADEHFRGASRRVRRLCAGGTGGRRPGRLLRSAARRLG